MSQKPDRNARSRTETPPAPREAQRKIAFSLPALILILALTFICGLLAGSFLTPPAQIVHQQVVQAPPAQPQAQAPAQSQAPTITPQQSQQIDRLEQQVRQHPDDRRALVSLGNLYFDTQQPQKAIQAYEKALALDPNDADVHTDLGVMYRAVGQYDKAVASFDRAQKIHPGHQIAMFNQGIVLNYDLHRHQDAIAVWTELVRLHPGARAPNGLPVSDLIREVSASLE